MDDLSKNSQKNYQFQNIFEERFVRMETKVVVVVAVMLLAMVVGGYGQCPSVTSFAPCLPYVKSPSSGNPSKGDGCCKLVLNLSEDCLCNAAKNPHPYPGVTIDFHKALTLPKVCGRKVPPNTVCNG